MDTSVEQYEMDLQGNGCSSGGNVRAMGIETVEEPIIRCGNHEFATV